MLKLILWNTLWKSDLLARKKCSLLPIEIEMVIKYYLCLLFNKIRDKGTTGSAWKQGWGEKEIPGDMGEKWTKRCMHM
jgi:hypothetical protein